MLAQIYEKCWKFLMWIPIILLAVSVAVLTNNFFSSGYIMPLGPELSGGKTIAVAVNEVDLNKIESEFPRATIRLSTAAQNLLVEISLDENETAVIEKLKGLVKFKGEPSVRIVGPAVANVFFQQAQIALLVAFLLMAVVVFLLFRTFVPSSLVILAAVTDIIVTMATISIIGIEFSLPVLAALLTIIGYSVDTDILLTTELLKGGGEIGEGIRRAAKTGLTLTATAIAALVAMYFVSGSFVLEEIALVLIIGLLIDMPATWLTNAGFLRRWLEKRKTT